MFKSKGIGFGEIYYSDLVPELEHFFTTRTSDVDNNRSNILKYLNITKDNLINPTQTHSSNISFAKEGIQDYPDTDAIILTNYTQAVYMRFADCTPIILYDKKANIAAIVHAGWRGTVNKIAKKTANKMLEYSKSTTNDIFVLIGPAIMPCCYNVGEEVAIKIQNSVTNYDNLIQKKNEKIFIDLKKTNQRQLTEYGIPDKNIDICRFCTSCNNDLFYSYRKENGTPNRHNAVIKLKK